MERGASKPLLVRLWQYVAWRFTIGLVYITGLTLLIPFIFLFVFPEDAGVMSAAASGTFVWVSIAMVIASFLATVLYTSSLGKSLQMLGRITFIPGFVGIVFAIFGRDLVLLYLASTVQGFTGVQQLLTRYVDNAVPKVRYLTLGFFVLGMLLWLLGDRIEAEASVKRAASARRH